MNKMEEKSAELQKIVTAANKRFNMDFTLWDFDEHNIILGSPTMGTDDEFDKRVDMFGDYLVAKTSMTVDMKYGFKNENYIITNDDRRGSYIDLIGDVK